MVDLVQVVTDHVARDVGLGEESVHWVSLAVRESVINAITHGNQGDASKSVFVEFDTTNDGGRRYLSIRVRDQGLGFDPASVGSPLTPDNLLRSSGRGIFLIRTFMDEVRVEPAPEGGMQIRMTKCVPATSVDNPQRD